MTNSPHMPANMPIAQQRIVRGDAVRRLPGSVAGDGPAYPRWDWPGLVNATGLFIAWPMDGPMTFTKVVIVMTQASAAIVFNITENGTMVDTITCTATQLQVITLTPSFSSVLDDLININITSIATGAAHGLHIALRP